MRTKAKVTRTEVFHRVSGGAAVRVVHAVPTNRLAGVFEVEGEVEGAEIHIGIEPSRARAIGAAITWLTEEVGQV